MHGPILDAASSIYRSVRWEGAVFLPALILGFVVIFAVYHWYTARKRLKHRNAAAKRTER